MRLLVVLVVALLAVSASAISHEEWQTVRSGLDAAMDFVKEKSASDFNVHAIPGGAVSLPETSELSVSCQAAVTAIQATLDNAACVTLRAGIAVDTTGSTTQVAMSAWCTSDCLTTLETDLATLSAQCTTTADRTIFTEAAYAAFVLRFRAAVFLARGVCVKTDAGKYCWPQLQQLKVAATLGAAATTAILTAACDDECTPLLTASLNTFGHPALLVAVKALDLVCLKRDGEFCTPVLRTLSTAVSVGANGRPDFSVLCSPCFIAYINAVGNLAATFSYAAGAAVAAAESTVSLYCAKAADGDYCINKFLDAQSSAGTTRPCVGLNATCSTECRAQVNTLSNELGCCLGSIFAVVGGGGQVETFLTESCGVILTECSGLVVRGSLRIRNFLYAYYVANKAAIDAAIKADLALKLAIAIARIKIEAAADASTTTSANGFSVQSASTTGVSVTYTVTPDTSSQAAGIASTITTSLSSDSSMPSVSQATVDGRADPTEPVTADSASSSATVATNPNGEVNAASSSVTARASIVVAATAAAVFALL